MGANSSSQAGSSAPAAGPRKTCYYDLLEVPHTATDSDIKKAYRRKALVLHPDRNFNDEARTTALFAEVQTAYEVLSDPQERAWYDAHRESILSGTDPRAGGGAQAPEEETSAEEVMGWMGRFSVRMSFEDEAKDGFFVLAREAFAKLAEEERRAAEWEGVDDPELPGFGHAWDKYEDEGSVKRFYQRWASFRTVKSFAWCDVYRLSDAPDRRVRRLMEKDNNKAREAARGQFNEAVAALVKFVRKRDPRYTPNSQTEAMRAKELRERSRQQARRMREENARAREAYQVPSWAAVGEEAEEKQGEGEMPRAVRPEEMSDSEVEEEEWYECVVCKKGFRSKGMMEAHEKSKKHAKAVWELKKKMRKENKEFDLERDVWSGTKRTEEFTMMEDDDHVPLSTVDGDHIPLPQPDDDYIPISSIDNDHIPWPPKDDHIPIPAADDDHIPISQPKPGSSPETDSEADSDYAPTSTFHARTVDELADTLDATTLDDSAAPSPAADDAVPAEDEAPAAPKIGKAKAKRLKKAEKQQQAQVSGEEFKCTTCKNQFSSKTKLFNHLKENPSHAKLVPVVGGGGKKGKKVKR